MPLSRQSAINVPELWQSGIRGDAGGNPPAAHQRFQDTDAACRADRQTIEFMYIHPAVRFQCAYAGHKGEFTVGMRPACIALCVLSYSFAIGFVPTFQYFQYS